jgi:DNA-binding NtrC family response regulator
VKFLRILENGEFQRVGSSAMRHVDVRVIAATNKNLEHEVQAGNFRADLFYRLRSVNIVVPPLRNRVEDIPLLFQHFATEVSRRNSIPFGGVSPAALNLLQAYHWPGNVRELRNVVESMLVLENGRFLEAEDVRKYLKEYRAAGQSDRNLPIPLGKSVEQAERELILRALLDIKGGMLELKSILTEHIQNAEASHAYLTDPPSTQAEPASLSLDMMERKLIEEALERYNGNRRVAARALKISERTLYRKIKEYGLEEKG